MEKKQERTLQELPSEIFGQPFEISLSFSDSDSFPVNISEKNNDIIIEAHLPGFKKNEIHVDIEGNNIIISARKKSAKEEHGKNFYVKEAGSSSINRSFSLPAEIEDVIETKLQDGVLFVKLKKASRKKKSSFFYR